MSNNFFPDGFPTTPIEAINAAASLGFLTSDEQQGWFKWMETSTPSQQQELVETLHLIFIDHQKQSPAIQNFGQNQPNQDNFQNNQQSNQFQQSQQNSPNFNQQNQTQFQQNPQQNGQNQPNFGQNSGQNQQYNPANNSTNNFNQNNQETFQNNPQSNQFNSQNSQFGRDNSNFGQDSMKNEQQNWQNNSQSFENSNQNSNQRQNSNQANFSSANSTQNFGQNQPNFGQNSGQNNSNNFNSNNSNNGKNLFSSDQNDFEKQQNEYQKELDSFENKNSQNNFDNPNSGQSSTSRPVIKANQSNSDFEFDENVENKNNNSDNPYSNSPSEESFLNLANSKYTPNPILDNNEPTPKEFVYQNEPQSESKIEKNEPKELEKAPEKIKVTEKITEKTEPKTDTKTLVKEKIVEKIIQEPEPVVEFADENDDFSFEDEKEVNEKTTGNVNFDNHKESIDPNLISTPNNFDNSDENTVKQKSNAKPFYSAPERTQLEEVYNQFVTSQKKKMDDQQEFSSHKLILDEDAWSKQSEFFGKVMEVMSNYEQMTDSLLKLNAQNIELARKIKVLENATQIRPSSSSVQRVLDGLSIDIKNLSRDFDDFRTDIYSQQRDISEQVAAATADTFKSDGIKQQIDLLANRITRMETQR